MRTLAACALAASCHTIDPADVGRTLFPDEFSVSYGWGELDDPSARSFYGDAEAWTLTTTWHLNPREVVVRPPDAEPESWWEPEYSWQTSATTTDTPVGSLESAEDPRGGGWIYLPDWIWSWKTVLFPLLFGAAFLGRRRIASLFTNGGAAAKETE